jgi:hypothetical protein
MTIGLISAACIFGGALLGLLLQGLLPEHHLRDTSKDTVKVAAGMIATLGALVLGLLVGSAKSSFDATNTAITQNGAKIILLDRVLATYGPETKDAREQLRGAVAAGIEMFWPEEKNGGSGMTGFERANAMEVLQAKLRTLTPTTDTQRQVTLAGGADQRRYAASPLAVNRASAERAPDAVSRGASLLAHHAAPKLWPVRAAQCDRDHRAAHQRVVCVGGDLYYPGNEPPAARHDQSFQRADAKGLGTSRPIGN